MKKIRKRVRIVDPNSLFFGKKGFIYEEIPTSLVEVFFDNGMRKTMNREKVEEIQHNGK